MNIICLLIVCSYVINDGISIVLDSKYIKYKYTLLAAVFIC